MKKLRHGEPKPTTQGLVPDGWQSQNQNTSHLHLSPLLFLPHPDLLIKLLSLRSVNISYNWRAQALKKDIFIQLHIHAANVYRMSPMGQALGLG